MSITFEDARDVIRYIAEHPELVRELRPLVLSEELLRLPEQMREWQAGSIERFERMEANLARWQTESNERFERLEADLARWQAESNERFERLEANLARWQAESNERFERLEAAISENSRQIERLIEAQERFDARQVRFEAAQARLEGRMGNFEGQLLEVKYDRNADAWFGQWLRRPRHASWDDVTDRLELAVEAGEISDAEVEDVRRLDILMSGRLKPSGDEGLLAAEISTTINVDDISRATRRAAILQKAGYRAIPFVGGQSISAEAQLQSDVTPGLIVDLRPAS